MLVAYSMLSISVFVTASSDVSRSGTACHTCAVQMSDIRMPLCASRSMNIQYMYINYCMKGTRVGKAG